MTFGSPGIDLGAARLSGLVVASNVVRGGCDDETDVSRDVGAIADVGATEDIGVTTDVGSSITSFTACATSPTPSAAVAATFKPASPIFTN